LIPIFDKIWSWVSAEIKPHYEGSQGEIQRLESTIYRLNKYLAAFQSALNHNRNDLESIEKLRKGMSLVMEVVDAFAMFETDETSVYGERIHRYVDHTFYVARCVLKPRSVSSMTVTNSAAGLPLFAEVSVHNRKLVLDEEATLKVNADRTVIEFIDGFRKASEKWSHFYDYENFPLVEVVETLPGIINVYIEQFNDNKGVPIADSRYVLYQLYCRKFHTFTKFMSFRGFKVAGKTGTAQIPIAGHYDEEKTIASFVGFAPFDDPEFVMLVTLKEPKTSPWASETAAPLWYSIAEDLFVHFRIQPDR